MNNLYVIARLQLMRRMAAARHNLSIDLHRQTPPRQTLIGNQLCHCVALHYLTRLTVNNNLHTLSTQLTIGDPRIDHIKKRSAFYHAYPFIEFGRASKRPTLFIN